MPLAAHVATTERARALYLLTLADRELDAATRSRLDDLYELLLSVLADPELTGRDARNLLERRRAEAQRAATDPRAVERLATAPRAWLLAHPPPELARQASLLDPPLRPGRYRVAAADDRVDVVTGDRRGVLAAVANAVTRDGLVIDRAATATWPDGAVIMTFAVDGDIPAPAALAERLRRASFVSGANPIPGVNLDFDDQASPWHTVVDVTAPDRPGLLASLAAAFSAAGLSIHSLEATTTDGVAHDRFELTDRHGVKVSEADRAKVDAMLRPRANPPSTRNIRLTAWKPPALSVARTGSVARTQRSTRDGRTSMRRWRKRSVAVGLFAAVWLLVGTQPALADGAGHRHLGVRRGRRRRRDQLQPVVDRARRGPGHLHAGRFRPGRDRLLSGQARGPRGDDQLRHLRPGLRRLLPGRLRHHVRGLLGHDRSRRRAGDRRRGLRRLDRLMGDRDTELRRADRLGHARLGRQRLRRRGHGVLPLHGGVHGHDGHDPDRARWPSGGSSRASFCGALFCGAIYYPLFGAWTWGGGWLSQLGKNFSLGHGYVDFAGSGVVHAMGGVAALAGAKVLGARIGKYGKDGKPRDLAAHHIPMALLGTSSCCSAGSASMRRRRWP